MRRHLTRFLLSWLACASFAATASAQWSPSGARLCQSGCGGFSPIVIDDGQGGAFVTWVDSRSYPATDDDAYLQRITALGTIASGWPPAAFPVTTNMNWQYVSALSADGEGGVIVGWLDSRNVDLGTLQDIYAQRILGDGTLAPGWPPDGAPVTRAPGYQSGVVIAPDGAGGAYLAWEDERDYALRRADVYAQHLTATGAVAPGWPQDGLAVCALSALQGTPQVLADGAGGAVVVWRDGRTEWGVYAQRLQPDGTIAPGWVENGLPVALGRVVWGVVPDRAGGFYAGCATIIPLYDSEYYVQRFSFAGARAPGWPAGGVQVCGAPAERGGLRMAEDGVGGALLCWYDYRPPETGGEIYAGRVLPDGSLAPGWTVDGARVSDDTGAGVEYDPFIAGDGRGGAYLVWQREYSGGFPALVQHLSASGAVAPGWMPYGQPAATSGAQLDGRIASDGRGGAIVAWAENATGRLGLYAQRFVMDGVVAVAVSLVRAEATPERVRLVWQVAGGASFHATVERRGERSGWERMADVNADGAGRIEYEDRDVATTAGYGYRLAYVEDGAERHSAETWVEVPAALALSLEGLRPNPALGELTVSLTLPSAAPARLELFDAGGRLILAREVGAFGAGRHRVQLAERTRLSPGLYWLRLTQGTRALTARGVVVR